MNPKLVAGKYDSSLGSWTDGGVGYTVRFDGATAHIGGEVPYEDADAVLGLAAGNRVALKFVNDDIASRDSLPSGNIATIIGDTVTNTYDKSAFESDGSLILVTNVTHGPVIVKIKWTAGVESVYTLDFAGAGFAQE